MNREELDERLWPFVKEVAFEDDIGGKRDRFVGNSGLHSDDLIGLFQDELGFCCCGSPEENLAFVRDGLQYIRRWIELAEASRENERSVCIKIFKTDTIASFFFYWADSAKLTEHGSVIPGWLTHRGDEFLEALEALTESGYLA